MPFVKNYFYKIIFLLTLIYFLVSCGAINDSKKPAGNHKNKAFDPIQLSGSESGSESRPDNTKNNQASQKLQLLITKYPFSPAAQRARSKIGDFE